MLSILSKLCVTQLSSLGRSMSSSDLRLSNVWCSPLRLPPPSPPPPAVPPSPPPSPPNGDAVNAGRVYPSPLLRMLPLTWSMFC